MGFSMDTNKHCLWSLKCYFYCLAKYVTSQVLPRKNVKQTVLECDHMILLKFRQKIRQPTSCLIRPKFCSFKKFSNPMWTGLNGHINFSHSSLWLLAIRNLIWSSRPQTTPSHQAVRNLKTLTLKRKKTWLQQMNYRLNRTSCW